ncbi:hypothetical protein ACFFQW_13325 [Umezawaea endophytica]|uniref:hypothetical protein n=1 Tax=Umezawaea endophytica TaxID=1654476 RepID=UPI0035E77472
MNETPGITPPRPLPPEVRERLRGEFERGVDRRRVPAVPVLGAAAAVVLLAGTVFVLRQVPDAEPTAAGGPGLDRVAAEAALDRCWAAVQSAGVADRFPERSRWRPSFTVGDARLGVVAARADGRPLFCQTTATTATVTDPSAAPGGGTTAALFSREGVVAGVTDVNRIVLANDGPVKSLLRTLDAGDRMFVALTDVNPGRTALTVRTTGPERVLAAPEAPAIVVRDRPDGPPPDRASDAGSALGACLDHSSTPVRDPDSYEPGATVLYPGGRFVLGRGARGVVSCRSDEQRTRAVVTPVLGGDQPAVVNFPTAVAADRQVVTGELSAEVASIEIGFDGGPPVPAAVANRTFVLLVPAEVGNPSVAALHVVVRDAEGRVLLEGPWSFWK